MAKPILLNPDGSFSTERTITVGMDGKYLLIPTIVGGKQFSEDEAIKAYRQGINKAVGIYGSESEASAAAVLRSKQIGINRGAEATSLRNQTSTSNDLDSIKKALATSSQQAQTELGTYSPPQPSGLQKYVLTPFGKILDVLDTDLNLVTKGLEPIVTAMNPSLKSVYDEKGFNVMPSDLIEKSLENTPARKILSPILGFAANVALSPTTYLAGVGTLTKAGKLFKRVSSLAEAGQAIKLDSKIAGEIAAHYGESTVTPALINRAVKEAKTVTVASLDQQAKMGQRALINIGVPFTKSEVPLLRSELFFRGVEKSADAFKKSKVGEVFNNIFSTSSGNPKFDSFRQSIVGLLKYRIEGDKEIGARTGKLVNQISKQTGLSRDEVFKWVTDIPETFRGEVSADAILTTYDKNITKQLVDAHNIEKVVDNLPGVQSMVMDEKGKLFRALMRNAKERQAGFDVFNVGFMQLPSDVRDVFVKEWTNGIGIRYAKDIKKGIMQYANFPQVIEAFNKGIKFKGVKLEPGEDAALFTLVGKDEYLRIKGVEERYTKLIKTTGGNNEKWVPGVLMKDGKFITGWDHGDALMKAENLGYEVNPNELGQVSGWRFGGQIALDKDVGNLAPEMWAQQVLDQAKSANVEGKQLRDTAHRLRAHIDQGFTTSYTLFRNSPEYLKSISPRMYKLMQKIDSTPEWKITSLVDQYKVPLKLAKSNPELFNMAEQHRMYFQNQLQRELDAGVPVREWVGDFNYIPHVPTKEVRDLLGKKYGEFSGGARQWNMDHQSTLQRKLRNINSRVVEEFFNTGEITKVQRKSLLGPDGLDYAERLQKTKKWSDAKVSQLYKFLTVSQSNVLAQQGKLKILGAGVKVDRFFEDNPASQILVRGIRGEKAITSIDFYDGAKNFGTWHPINEALPEGKVFTKNEKANPLAAVKNQFINGVNVPSRLIFDKGIAKHIDALHTALTLPPELHPFLKVYDGVQAEWKAWTLAIFPAYHIRNVVGNLWNNYLGGIHTPDPYLKANIMQLGKNISIELGAGGKMSGKQVLSEANKAGILNVGQYFGDIEDYFKTELKEGIGKYYKKGLRPPVAWGLKVGNRLENNAKLAMFIRRLEEGYSIPDAAMEVKKYLFDYSDLTVSERDVLRRVFPFYSWTRKNVPLQLEALVTHPARLMTVAKAKNVMESNYDGVPDERLLPDYYTQNFPIRVRYDTDTKQFQYLLLNNWLPAADIDKIFDPVTWAKNQLTPLLKEPIQQIANRDFFTNREIDKGDEYQTLKIFNMNLNLPARQIHALKNIRLLNELDKYSKPGPTEEKVGQLFTGKVYSLDEDKQRKFLKIEFKDRKNVLRSALKKAIANDNTSEQERIHNELQKLSEEKSSKL